MAPAATTKQQQQEQQQQEQQQQQQQWSGRCHRGYCCFVPRLKPSSSVAADLRPRATVLNDNNNNDARTELVPSAKYR